MRTELGQILDEVLRSHRLPTGPTSPLATDDFDAFLEWREQALEEALAVMTGQGTPAGASRSPERSSLDVQVEGVELELRRIIADTLAGEADALRNLSSQMRHQAAWVVCGERSSSGVAGGSLIQARAGIWRGRGRRWNRSGWVL